MSTHRRVASSARELAERRRAGGPAGDWSEAEQLLAMLILIYADPARLGGTKKRNDGTSRQHPAVVAAARAVGRTEGAVVMKVMNLRKKLTESKGMGHGGRLDAWVVQTFATHLDLLVAACVVVSGHVPDAEDVLAALGVIEAREGDQAPPSLPTHLHTDRLRDGVVVRRGHGGFANRVMSNFADTCGFCGLHAKRPERRFGMLVAGHIKPWAEANDHERLDPSNGLALCAIHDRAFEAGFMTLDDDLKIVASRTVLGHLGSERLVQNTVLDFHGEPLRGQDRKHFLRPGSRYLEFHRDSVYER